MNWQGVVQRLGQVQTVESLARDPFYYFAASPGPKAKISSTVGRSLSYGDVKVSFTVTIECPQNEHHMNIAAEIAGDKAAELVDEVFLKISPDALPLPRMNGGQR